MQLGGFAERLLWETQWKCFPQALLNNPIWHHKTLSKHVLAGIPKWLLVRAALGPDMRMVLYARGIDLQTELSEITDLFASATDGLAFCLHLSMFTVNGKNT